MFTFDPDRRIHGEYKGARVTDGALVLLLKGFKPFHILYSYDYADCELRNIAQAMRDGQAEYILNSDHRADLDSEDA